LQKLLGYDEWRNFLKVIEKAQESCKTANNPILDHFVDTNKSIPVPKGGERIIEDFLLIGNRRSMREGQSTGTNFGLFSHFITTL
jgi:hypothetical protein